MKNYETKELPAKTIRSLKNRTCDLCGTTSTRQEHWGRTSYEVNETEVSITVAHKTGISYPEGGSGQLLDVDICPSCFQSKLIPWLKSQGAKIEAEDWDW